MASEVKIQGKTIADCVESLRMYSERFAVTYKATFGLNFKEFIIKPSSCISKDCVYLSFMWRHEYREYDNSY